MPFIVPARHDFDLIFDPQNNPSFHTHVAWKEEQFLGPGIRSRHSFKLVSSKGPGELIQLDLTMKQRVSLLIEYLPSVPN